VVAEEFDQFAEPLEPVTASGAEAALAHLEEDFLKGILAHLDVHGFGNSHF
jgi:hypothetical protein